MLRTFLAIAFALQITATLSAQQLKPPASTAGKSQATAHTHNHGAHGPNHGELLEIGRGEFHAELVVDEETKQIVVYLLDSTLKSYVSIDAAFLAVNFKVGNKPAQVKLLPVPQEADAKNASSRYSLISPELFSALHDSRSDAKLSLRIGKKSYVSKLAHDHDHAHVGHKHTTTAPKKR